jgi:uncharacterized membrane protein YGL010W
MIIGPADENNIIVTAVSAEICKVHVSQLLHKQCIGQDDLIISPADIFSHKCDLFFVNHACG